MVVPQMAHDVWVVLTLRYDHLPTVVGVTFKVAKLLVTGVVLFTISVTISVMISVEGPVTSKVLLVLSVDRSMISSMH